MRKLHGQHCDQIITNPFVPNLPEEKPKPKSKPRKKARPRKRAAKKK